MSPKRVQTSEWLTVVAYECEAGLNGLAGGIENPTFPPSLSIAGQKLNHRFQVLFDVACDAIGRGCFSGGKLKRVVLSPPRAVGPVIGIASNHVPICAIGNPEVSRRVEILITAGDIFKKRFVGCSV